MSYNFEALNDERFQQLAQAVLVRAFPNAQCLPVGQPDGGRDAFVLNAASRRSSSTIIFQVKFSRNPAAKAEREVIAEVVRREKQNVDRLKKRGATAYYLITNVAGTAHPDVGSIDQVNALLTNELGLPSYCWWRDDISARIDSNSDVKWSFPDIMRGSDVLQFLIDGTWKESAELRKQTLRSYLASQFSDDQEVKFKQVELQNRLLDLFVDLPVAPVDVPKNRRRGSFGASSFRSLGSEFYFHEEMFIEEDRGVFVRRRAFSDAAATLLHTDSIGGPNRIVIEGAPGQGKSTITQYLCQVNRIKLLDKSYELSFLPVNHREAPVRIPFRVDLRDFATWLSGRNPFAPEGQIASASTSSLEGFLATQVSHFSGGNEFNIADVIAVTKSGHILIVLDGFDEVADIRIRNKVVEEITKGAARIQAHEVSAQIVVTSRPAAFANSPGFPHDEWLHLEIQAMSHPQIDAYSKKWMAARSLPARERLEFTNLLKEKLEQPHMRDLARNPMQLTILLALIHTRGLSLPDKRTSLYDNYMELFFNRESEKSRVVREHRDLLVDIHRFLAWTLHSEAEGGASGGSIAEGALKVALKNYLEREGHDPGLVEELFTGMVERVVALVSRVQGTFEFEVQPLREYFAARHLYETAPYSPPGNERTGTKPERFNALARNFYWLNVLRFFCGCFSRGELASLADGLAEISRSEKYGLIAHPRTLSVMLLGDWVFSQQPLSVKRVVDEIFEQPGLKVFLSGATPPSASVAALPDRCGRQNVSQNAYAQLNFIISDEDRASILALIRDNTELEKVQKLWAADEPQGDADALQWLSDGRRLGVIGLMEPSRLRSVVSKFGVVGVSAVLRAGRSDALTSDPNLLALALDCLLDGTCDVSYVPRAKGTALLIDRMGQILSPFIYKSVITGEPGISTRTAIRRHSGEDIDEFSSNNDVSNPATASMDRFIKLFVGQLELDSSVWASSIEPWAALIQAGTDTFGSRWSFMKLAVLAAGVKSNSETGTWSDKSWSDGENLAFRMRYARLRSGNAKWWRAELRRATSEKETKLVCLMISIWGTARTLALSSEEASIAVDALSDEEWRLVYRGFNQILYSSEQLRKSLTARDPVLPPEASPRLHLLIARRGNNDYANLVYMQRLMTYEGKDKAILDFLGEMAVLAAVRDRDTWNHSLDIVQLAYGRGASLSGLEREAATMPDDIAEVICSNAELYPQSLIRAAQLKLSASLGASAPKVGVVALHEGWFQ